MTVATPSYGGLDVPGFQYGNVIYPLTAVASGASLLSVCDPAVAKLTAYIKKVIETHVGPALLSAASGFAPITAAVAQTIPIEPREDMFAKASGFKFPMLAVWRKDSETDWHTTEFQHDTTKLQVAYILPPLSAVQEIRISPVLAAVYHVISYAFLRGYDPTYNNGERINVSNNIEHSRVKSASYEKIKLGESDTMEFSALATEIEIVEGNEPYTVGASLLNASDVVITDESVEPGNPVEIIAAETDFPVVDPTP